jgi:hypothetical protein
MFRKIPDSFLAGVIIGAGVLMLVAYLVSLVREIYYGQQNVPNYLLYPKPELLIVALNVFLFRQYVVKYKREATGKGILFATVIIVLLFYFIERY